MKCTCGHPDNYNYAINNGLCNSCISEKLEQLETELDKHHWIPVEEQLPEETEDDLRPQVLVFDGESVTGALWRHYECGWDFETDRGKPTHWKPIILPEQALKGIEP